MDDPKSNHICIKNNKNICYIFDNAYIYNIGLLCCGNIGISAPVININTINSIICTILKNIVVYVYIFLS
jgi:hypothetical protein